MAHDYDWEAAAERAQKENECIVVKTTVRSNRVCVLRTGLTEFSFAMKDNEAPNVYFDKLVVGPFDTYAKALEYIEKQPEGDYDIVPFIWS